MFLVTDMGRCLAFVIDPTMKGIFKQAPAQEARAKSQVQKQDAATQDDRFPEQEEQDGQRIADKAEPVVDATRRQTDQMAFCGITKRLLFTVSVNRHCHQLSQKP